MRCARWPSPSSSRSSPGSSTTRSRCGSPPARTGRSWPSRPRAATMLDIREYTDEHHAATVPHTLVLAPGLVIDKVYVGYWFWGRPSPRSAAEDLQDLHRRIEPDFDPPTTPGARAAYAAATARAASKRSPAMAARCRSARSSGRQARRHAPSTPAPTRRILAGNMRANGSSASRARLRRARRSSHPRSARRRCSSVDTASGGGSASTRRRACWTARSSNASRTPSGGSTSEIRAASPSGSTIRSSTRRAARRASRAAAMPRASPRAAVGIVRTWPARLRRSPAPRAAPASSGSCGRRRPVGADRGGSLACRGAAPPTSAGPRTSTRHRRGGWCRSGKSVNTAGTYGSLSVSVVSRRPSSACDGAVGVGQERPSRAEPGAEGGRDRGRVDAHGHDARVGDLRLVLQRDQAAEERLLLRAPPAAEELQDRRVAADELRETARVARVVVELDVRERPRRG